MKVIQTVPNIAQESSGPSYTVPRLCQALHKLGVEIELHTLLPSSNRDFSFPLIEYPRSKISLYRWDYSPEMKRELLVAAHSAGIIHTHSVGSAPSSIYPAIAAKRTGAKLVITPRGWLDPMALRNGKCFKRFKWHFLGVRRALESATMFHATAMSEYDYIRQAGFKQPVTIIPNGIDIPDIDLFSRTVNSSEKNRKLIFMSRIHSKKNIEVLLQAWNNIQDKFSNWELLIVGPDKSNSYADKMKTLSRRLNNKRVVFYGEVKGQKKLELLTQAELFVLPTHTENFGMVVAEALSCATAVICTKGAPWQGLEENQCGWWIDHGEEALTDSLKCAMSKSPEELFRMGTIGRRWMEKDFSWNKIGKKMKKSYEWMLSDKKDNKPDWIKID